MGFAEPTLQTRFCLNVCSSGLEKRGKTYWAFTAPEPIVALSTDTGTEEIAEGFRKAGKKVALTRVRVPREAESIGAKEKEWATAVKVIAAVIKSPHIRTFIVDTGTEFWELLRLARFGKLAQVQPYHYGPVNAEMRDIVKELCELRNLNTVWVHKHKKEYGPNKKGDDAWTGRYERGGFGDMAFLCGTVLEHRRVTEDNVTKFSTIVQDSRYQAETLIGVELEGEMNNFATMAQLSFPDSNESDWK